MAKFGFAPEDVDMTSAAMSYDPVPAGEYTLRALDAEEKATRDGTGSYINVKFEVADGEHRGRLMWNVFNVINQSEKAQSIGRQQLVAWATACGKPDADDTDKLLDKPFRARVDVEPAQGQYRASNRIKAFLLGGNSGASAAPAPRAAAPAPRPATPAAGVNPSD